MDELRKNQNVTIETNDKRRIEGVVFDFLFDRVLVEINEEFLKEASFLRELQELNITVDTPLGLKKMTSCVISVLNQQRQLLIENNPAFIIVTRREFSRIKTEIDFTVVKNKTTYNAKSIDISGNGIAFNCPKNNFSENDIIDMDLCIDGNNMKISASIIRIKGDFCTAKYTTINPKDQDKIVRYVFKLGAKN